MNMKLILAIIPITLALVFYTIGVFGERKAKTLKKGHVIIFWLGLLCDAIGTFLMGQISKSQVQIENTATQTIHGVTGVLAIVLMLFHALWSTWVLYKDDENKKAVFHKFSITVWIVWLIPYIIGMIIGMS
ncbi:HsmA family protein [Clostridium taeniosporum]|uniref:TIGR03987 family protein n=1 Tax=Clostridium taeniosporum TaxID=394958 RepID=A0A1D7XN90_9CLOT|nr:HsmA family protein [Clostridium taeniosporum]AOR24815.1 TIGR03987 family protein [Clostridium taeniosporum]